MLTNIQKLREKEGGTYIEAAFVIMVLMWMMAVISAFLPIFSAIYRVNVCAGNVARIMSVEGGLTADASEKIEEYKQQAGLDSLQLNYSKSEFFDGYKVQLNDAIVVEARSNYYFELIGVPVRIPIDSTAVARSEVYYK